MFGNKKKNKKKRQEIIESQFKNDSVADIENSYKKKTKKVDYTKKEGYKSSFIETIENVPLLVSIYVISIVALFVSMPKGIMFIFALLILFVLDYFIYSSIVTMYLYYNVLEDRLFENKLTIDDVNSFSFVHVLMRSRLSDLIDKYANHYAVIKEDSAEFAIVKILYLKYKKLEVPPLVIDVTESDINRLVGFNYINFIEGHDVDFDNLELSYYSKLALDYNEVGKRFL